jgi:FKBP-type peptidyl-prolyl cis-trans isomerase FkpA
MGAFAVSRKQQMNEVEMDINLDMLKRGFIDGLAENSQLSQEELTTLIRNADQEIRARQEALANQSAEDNIAAGKAFLAENANKEGVVVTESGLQYEVLVEGTGTSPSATDTVRVHYRGTLLDGTEFDSSYKRGEPAEFPLNRVIPGWTEGVQLMKEGAKFKFYIPSELAYGTRSTGAITPNSTLVFEVELLDVVTAEDAGE